MRENQVRAKTKAYGITLLFLTSFIWGIAFVAQSVGMNYLQPFAFNGIRFVLGGIVLIPVIILSRKSPNYGKDCSKEQLQERKRQAYRGGVVLGFILFIATMFQQYGILYTSAGKAGFLTALYIIIIPFLTLLLGKKSQRHIWIGAILSLVGIYLLSVKEGFSISLGDGLLMICAFVFAIQIMVTGHYAQIADAPLLSCVQFFVTGGLALIGMCMFERPTWADVWAAWIPLGYAGFLSSGVAYTLQVVGQRYVIPSLASMIFSLEAVFSVVAGFILLGERMQVRELFGCALVFVAILIAQRAE